MDTGPGTQGAIVKRTAALLFGVLAAAIPAAAHADDAATFEAACRKVGGSADVCACKAGAAVRLLDERMLGLVVMSMGDPGRFAALSASGEISHADNVAWTHYIRESNQACNLNY